MEKFKIGKRHFYGNDLYNLQVFCSYPDRPITPEQRSSIKNLLGFFSEYNYNLALMTARGDQYWAKLKDRLWHDPSIRNFIEHIEQEYKIE